MISEIVGKQAHPLSEELRYFFSLYKSLEGVTTVVNEFGGTLEAVQVIAHAIENYKKKFGET